MSVLKKILSVLAIVLIAVLVVYGLAMLLGKQVMYPAFSRNAQKGVLIPALSKGFTPQGVSFLDDCTLVCGYYPGSEASRIYMVYEDGSVREILLKRENGDVYTGHAGGLTASGAFVYVSNASKLFVLKTADLRNAESGSYVQFAGNIPVPCRASFCSSDGQYVYVGDYHADGYETDESHRIKTSDGEHFAMVYAYKLDPGEEFGLQTEPSLAFSVRDLVQGFAVSGDNAVMSCSSGFSSSNLYFYTIGTPDGTFEREGMSMPLYILDGAKQKDRLRMPHMSEDVEIRDGKVLVGFESAARKMLSGFIPCSIRNIMIVPLT
ncbi:MAG: hypothetical protein IJM52_01995 [Spirochaetales bacterium]|nr:hypothetical protein [Spirochaetales bacterium]MBQ4501005.1 hypothetical protein [Spirochaetales bacterium]MBQ6124603.1 hypothetical protein [Spirochaetales bacterium]MBQ9809909.1 hypothetical protein [Spirochaetales bacterium]MBR6236007.1 hypothetical protein [Spirochaetales bacterium]